MERYFFGNNSGYGFFNLYEKELKSKDKVVLLKGGSGTGKSSMMKKIAKKQNLWDWITSCGFVRETLKVLTEFLSKTKTLRLWTQLLRMQSAWIFPLSRM